MIKYFILITLLYSSFCVHSQNIADVFFPENDISYYGQTGTNGKEYNGMGILKFNKSGIYAGDFSRGKFHGKGIQINPTDQPIKNCYDGCIYVGKWFRGKKEGYGILYNNIGELIYKGEFSNDKPIEQFLSAPDSIQRFSITEINGELFVGETINNIPNGIGIFLDDTGYTLCNVKNGSKYGVGILIIPPKNWGVFNIEDGLYYPIAFSHEQDARREKFKINQEKERMELINTFANLLVEGSQIISEMHETINPSSASYSEDTYNSSSSNSGSSKNNKQQKNKKNSLSDQSNYNSDKATYSRYDSMLSAAFAGNREASDSEIKNWQSKMKKLRKKWEAKGKDFPHSSNEDK